MKSTTTAPKQVLVLQKTLDILEALKSERNGIGLADVARSVAMPKATVYRILATLEIRGYLDRSADGGYRMSDKLFSLQRDVSPEQNLLRVAPKIMEQTAEECRETVNLGTLDGGEVVVVATVESPQTVRMASKVGNRRYLHTTALGKILLSSMDDRSIRRLIQLKGLPKLTANSITTQTAMLAEIQKIRKQGYAIDNQENELEGRCIAMKISGGAGVGSALSISGPVFRMDLRRLRGLVPILRRGCEEISEALRN
jgi:IclR family transcriptional regulator, KDG regulon repressor